MIAGLDHGVGLSPRGPVLVGGLGKFDGGKSTRGICIWLCGDPLLSLEEDSEGGVNECWEYGMGGTDGCDNGSCVNT